MIKVTETIEIDEDNLEFKSLKASGPGGQHVNKNQTAIQLRFNITEAYTLGHAIQQRLIKLGGNRVNGDYELIITARRYRSQLRNRQDAMQRLFELIRRASEPPKPRIKRRRSYTTQQDRLESKHKRSEVKRGRRRVVFDHAND